MELQESKLYWDGAKAFVVAYCEKCNGIATLNEFTLKVDPSEMAKVKEGDVVSFSYKNKKDGLVVTFVDLNLHPELENAPEIWYENDMVVCDYCYETP